MLQFRLIYKVIVLCRLCVTSDTVWRLSEGTNRSTIDNLLTDSFLKQFCIVIQITLNSYATCWCSRVFLSVRLSVSLQCFAQNPPVTPKIRESLGMTYGSKKHEFRNASSWACQQMNKISISLGTTIWCSKPCCLKSVGSK